ncbi:MAG: ATP-binding protein [Syntrophobacterales bacterium]|nr:ATP-binding protein [Syntrophobacterales bacterium]
MIERTIEPVLKDAAGKYPVVTITGPRQSGKTTLCRKVFPGMAYVNLERPDTREYAVSDPRGFLATYPAGAILDEIQRAPHLLSYIQVLVDESVRSRPFILTGSQQFEMLNTVTQSLAGRTALLRLLPLSIAELAPHEPTAALDWLLLYGFYPRIHDQKLDPTQALGDYFATYVERDMRQMAAIKDLGLFEKFVKLCAGRIGQILNLQSLGNDAGVSHTTARAWISLLEASYVVFLLPPWYRNISKRLIKSPKLYFYDVGLASYLLGMENESHVSRHPLRGNLFENLVVIEALKYRLNRGKRSNMTFYRDGKGNEVDLVLESGPDVFPIEIKAGATIAADYFKGLSNFSKVIPPLENRASSSALVYGGVEQQQRGSTMIYPFSAIEKMLNELGVRS